MKKILITILSVLFFVNSSFSFYEDKILNKLEIEFKKLNFEQLDNVNYRLEDLKVKEKYNNKNYQKLFTKIGKVLENEIGKKVSYLHYSYVLDFDDDKNVLGFSDNVFVAKILKNNGPHKSDAIYEASILYTLLPESSYTVEVLYNIKGVKTGKIDIIMSGGKNKNGVLILPEGVKPLKENGIYLLATGLNSQALITHPNGMNLVYYNYKNKNSLSKIDTKSLIENNKKVQDFIKAYPIAPYYKTKNSYNDLTKKQKESLKTFDNGFVGELKEVR